MGSAFGTDRDHLTAAPARPRAPAHSRSIAVYPLEYSRMISDMMSDATTSYHHRAGLHPPTGPQHAYRYWPGVKPRGSCTVCVQPASFRTPPDSLASIHVIVNQLHNSDAYCTGVW